MAHGGVRHAPALPESVAPRQRWLVYPPVHQLEEKSAPRSPDEYQTQLGHKTRGQALRG